MYSDFSKWINFDIKFNWVLIDINVCVCMSVQLSSLLELPISSPAYENSPKAHQIIEIFGVVATIRTL